MGAADYLTTKVDIPGFHPKIQYHHAVLLAGSCFTDHIGNKLLRYKYNTLINPFGILYNPVSLAVSLERIAKQKFYHSDELVYHDGIYHSMDHHGSFSGKNKDSVIEKINSRMQDAYKHLGKSSFVFISPGTSKVYRYKPTGEIVGNCHKIPQLSFDYQQLTLADCEVAFESIYTSIRQIAPDAQIIWTVSPVRHIRDGLIENQRSKSTLILATHQTLNKYSGFSYFPAYEIMVDQMRDYRYYARDLIHPSDVAIDMIWDIFCNTYLDPPEMEYHQAIEKIRRAMEHRLIHDDTAAIKTFAQNQLKQIEHLAGLLPNLDWQRERQYFFHLLEID